MANTKEYKIVINGLTESLNAVESLNKQLDGLEQRMKTLSSANVSVGGGGSTSSNSALSEEDKVLKDIEKTQEKINDLKKEEYQELLHQKDILKDVKKESAGRFAQDNLALKDYANTMQGLKDRLADLKAAINVTDLGDTEKLSKMTAQANALTSKLKEMEQAYGTFGRNVGNYANGVAEGIGKVAVNVGGIDRVFNSAKEAARTLGNELKTMAANGQQNTQAFKDLQQAVIELDSNIKDAKKPMDSLMDSMQSVMAIANLGQGIRGLFGVDDAEIQKSIKNLVALQNVLKGIETINNQIKAKEGIGKWIAPINTGIDKATAKLLVFNKALLGTSKAAKTVAVGINLFSKALKVAFTGGILIAVDYLVEKLMGLVESFKKVDKAAEEAKETQKAVSKAYAEGSATLLKYQTIVNNFNGTKKEEKKLVNELNSQLGTSLGTYKTLAEWMDVLTKKGSAYVQMLMLQAKAQAAFNKLVAAQEAEMNAKEASTEDYRTFLNDIQDFISPGWGTKSANRARVSGIQAATAYREGTEEAFSDVQKELQEFMKTNKIGDFSPQIEKNASNMKKTISEEEKELAQLRISNMKEGLNKTIKQLEEERKQRLAKISKNSKNYKELEIQINAYYDKKIIDATEEYSKKREEIQKNMWSRIYAYSLETERMIYQNSSKNIEKIAEKYDKIRNESFTKGQATSYGIQGKEQLSKPTQIALGLNSTATDEMTANAKKQIDLFRRYDMAYNNFIVSIATLTKEEKNVIGKELKAIEKEYNDFASSMKEKYGESYGIYRQIYENLINESYSDSMVTTFEQRLAKLEAINQAYKKERMKVINEDIENEKALRFKEYNAEEREAAAHQDKMIEELERSIASGYTTQKEADEIRERLAKEYQDRSEALWKKYQDDIAKIENKGADEIKKINSDSLQERLMEFRDFQTAINELERRQPVVNIWGITNLKETKKNNQELLKSYEVLASEILAEKKRLQEELQKNELSFDDFQNATRELDNFQADLGEKMDKIRHELDGFTQFGHLVQDLQLYIQAIGSAIQDVMNAVWDYQDYMFDKEQDELDKENDELEKKLDKQQDIVEKHKDAINSIEDELATARGDRRQHLIDQLNAEIAAQRAAAAEEKRIQKEKEANEKKQEELAKKQREAEYKRNLMQIIVSTAMATANGLATQPFFPVGIAMGALATTLGMVQLALAMKQKPYANGGQLDGGVAQGKRHSEGGIPVLGGRASIEGGEMIVNRQTTSQNVDLLYYINSKKKKVNLDDLIEFYASGKPRKVIQGIRTRFADGGQLSIPQLDISDQLQNVVINQDNRPIYVTVTDIENKMEQVRYVKTLAGLK